MPVVKKILHGEKNGKETGIKSNIAVSDAKEMQSPIKKQYVAVQLLAEY